MTSKLLVAAAVAALAVACGGKAESSAPAESDFQIDETGSALVSDSATDGEATDDGSCKEGDHEHKGHKKHRFKALDLLDGVRDHQITLAALPANVSPHLVEKLHALDTNHDGVVTKDELKARRDHDHHGKKKHHEDRDDDHDDGDHESDHDSDD